MCGGDKRIKRISERHGCFELYALEDVGKFSRLSVKVDKTLRAEVSVCRG